MSCVCLMKCGIYAMDDLNVASRVNAFIFAVHYREQARMQYASKRDSADLSFSGMAFTCFAAAGAGLTAAGRMFQQAPPTPEWLVTLGVFTFVASLGGCVVAGAKSIIDSLAVPRIIEDEVRWTRDALENWSILRSCMECEE